ncbi:MAG: S9 family peptidase [Ilumatobacteraceae bacterium]|nr:S9 family peptidase [Ilumatobacteraceae bacterium]
MTDEAAPTPFHRLDQFVAIPRLSGLALSVGGSRLVTSVATLDADGKKFQTALWELDTTGSGEARRLTRSAPGEASPVFAPDGSLLFLSKRPDPDAGADAKDPKPALWSLPAEGGEARLVVSRAAGLDGVAVAADTGEVVVSASIAPTSDDLAADTELRDAREQAGVSAVLHENYPVRYWDHDLGSSVPHAFWVGDLPGDTAVDEASWRDLTPDAGVPHGVGESVVLSPSGRLLAYPQRVPDGPAGWRSRLVVVDTGTSELRVLGDADDASMEAPAFSPDSSRIVFVRQQQSTHDEPPDQTLVVVDLATGDADELTPGFDRWPDSPQFDAAGTAVYFVADDDGHRPIFRVVPGETPVRLTAEGAYSDLQVAADGSAIYALRSTVDTPPEPVRLDPSAAGQVPTVLPHPGAITSVPGTFRSVDAEAADGARVQSWLVLPDGASAESPAPLVLWIHGGPLMSWNAWSWRWCPWNLAAQGYAVLMPNPGLSQGFGQDFVRRGWGAWGNEPFTDLMAAVDAAVELPEIDASRTAAMGGSFGGYMANWVATQTDRFRAIVTHASLWHLDGFVGSTDASFYWEKEFGHPLNEPERYEANSPHRYADAIVTPMLVIHGDKDYRVPIGEGLRLWYDLQKREVPSKFLYFPDENHWVLAPGNARIWYDTVLAFLAEHVLDEEWRRPELL